MAEPKYEPEKVEIVADGLHIVWKDGLDALLPHRYLRGNCGCAECIDEMSRVRQVNVDDIAADVRIEDYLEVGRYALGLLFSDLHQTGIYPFKRLRDLADKGQGTTLDP